jgi:hypothetical protein
MIVMSFVERFEREFAANDLSGVTPADFSHFGSIYSADKTWV